MYLNDNEPNLMYMLYIQMEERDYYYMADICVHRY